MHLHRTWVAPWLFLLLGLVLAPLAYAGKTGAEPPTPVARIFPRAQLRAPEIYWSVLLFHPSSPAKDVVASTRKLLAAKYPQLNPPAVAEKARPEAVVEPARDEDLDPIDEDMLRYLGRTLT